MDLLTLLYVCNYLSSVCNTAIVQVENRYDITGTIRWMEDGQVSLL